jgi:AraC-like DNA-binding protein
MPAKARLSTLPTATGGIARAAYARALEARLDVDALLKSANLTAAQAKDARLRMPVRTQIKFLNEVADELPDPLLGIHLAEGVDLREMGLLYYVLASSETLGDALERLARYSAINNEGVRITCRERKGVAVKFEYVGVSRASDRHQIEFFAVMLIRICRHLTGQHLSPSGVKFAHQRTALSPGTRRIFDCDVAFASSVDEVAYPPAVKSMTTVNADAYLNALLVRYCEDALSVRRTRSAPWRLKVENAIVPLLPHGQAKTAEIANRLGVSSRTLARMLAAEGFTFRQILDDLRADLADRYLREHGLPISEVAWLLGFREVAAFSHAFKRRTGKTPKQIRSRSRRH